MRRDRIVELRRIAPSLLDPHPDNWRTHTDEDRAALRGLLEEVGWVGALIARPKPGGRWELLDGHMRQTISNEPVPVLVVDLDDDEAKKLLATYDQVTRLAKRDGDRLLTLIEAAKQTTTDAALAAFLEDVRESLTGLATAAATPTHAHHVPNPLAGTGLEGTSQQFESGIRAIVFYLTKTQHDAVTALLQRTMAQLGGKNQTDAFVLVMQRAGLDL